MDFAYTEAEEAFRRELAGWLRSNLPEHRKTYPPSDDELSLHPDKSFDACRVWHRRLHGGGWIAIHWPREYGGRAGAVEARPTPRSWSPPARRPASTPSGSPSPGRRSCTTAPRRSAAGGCRRCSPPTRSGARASPSPARAATSRTCRRARCSTATTSWSPARRCGPPTPTAPTTASCSCAPTPPRRSTRASRACSWT
jgi:hypothetical protein